MQKRQSCLGDYAKMQLILYKKNDALNHKLSTLNHYTPSVFPAEKLSPYPRSAWQRRDIARLPQLHSFLLFPTAEIVT